MIRRDLPAVIVLEAPPSGGCGPLGALDDATGDRLALAADLSRGRLLAGLERVNLIDLPGCGVGGEPWLPDAARYNATNMLRHDAVYRNWPDLRGRVVLLAGRRVLQAFAGALNLPPDLPTLVRVAWRGTEWVALPHPSGRRRWEHRQWNNFELCAAAGEIVRAEVLRREAALRSWSTFGEDGRTGLGGAR